MYIYDPRIDSPRGKHPFPDLDGRFYGYSAPSKGKRAKNRKLEEKVCVVGIDGLTGNVEEALPALVESGDECVSGSDSDGSTHTRPKRL